MWCSDALITPYVMLFFQMIAGSPASCLVFLFLAVAFHQHTGCLRCLRRRANPSSPWGRTCKVGEQFFGLWVSILVEAVDVAFWSALSEVSCPCWTTVLELWQLMSMYNIITLCWFKSKGINWSYISGLHCLATKANKAWWMVPWMAINGKSSFTNFCFYFQI